MRALAFLLTLLLGASARADGLTLLLQDGSRVPPGATFEVVVARIVDGAIKPIGDVELIGATRTTSASPFFATARARAPTSGTLSIIARSGGEEARATISVAADAAGTVKVRVEPASVIRKDGKAPPIKVFVDSEPGVLPTINASAGSIGALQEIAPGRYVAEYTPSDALYPEVVVFTAAKPWPHEGGASFALSHAVLSLSSSIVLPGETKPAVDITVEIAREKFGPVRADERGRFRVPVIIPPGHGSGTGVSVDRLGNKRQTRIDLRLPPTNRVAASVWPSELVADGRSEAEIAIVVVDKIGAPSREIPSVRAQKGRVGDVRPQGDGRFLVRYTPPSTVGDDVIEAKLPDRSRAEVRVRVLPGPPAALSATIAPTLITAPSNESARIRVDVQDAFGHPVSEAHIEVDAVIGGTLSSSAGETRYLAPLSAMRWNDRVVLRARAPAGTRPARVALAPQGIVVVDAVGRPVPKARVRLDRALVTADERGLLPLPVAPGLLKVDLEGRPIPATLFIAQSDDGALHGWPSHPGILVEEVTITLMEPVPVDVKAARTQDGVLEWVVIGGGDGPRRVVVSTPGRAPQVVERSGTLRLDDDARSLPITVTDTGSGVSAVVLP